MNLSPTSRDERGDALLSQSIELSPETCGVCGREEDIVGVAAVPAASVSISWCRECFSRHCQPLFALEVHVCPCDPDGDPYYDESIEHGVEYAKLKDVKPWEHLAPWYLDEQTWYEGSYIGVTDLLHRLWDEADPTQHVEVRKHPHSGPNP